MALPRRPISTWFPANTSPAARKMSVADGPLFFLEQQKDQGSGEKLTGTTSARWQAFNGCSPDKPQGLGTRMTMYRHQYRISLCGHQLPSAIRSNKNQDDLVRLFFFFPRKEAVSKVEGRRNWPRSVVSASGACFT